MAEFDISKLSGILKAAAKKIDNKFNKNGKIDGLEVSLFKIQAYNLKSSGQLSPQDYNSVFGNQNWREFDIKDQYICKQDNTYVAPPAKFELLAANAATIKQAANVDMRADITREAEFRGTKLTEADIEKWNKVIVTEAKRYNVPPEVLIVVIGKECHYKDPHLNKPPFKNNDGCMQVIPSSVNNIKRDRWGIYDNVNSECRNDTIQNLKTHDLTDRSTGIKAGILIFQTNYAQAVARIKGWKSGKQPDIKKAAEALKDGTVQLSPSEAKEAMRMALRDYNGSSRKESYAADCIKRLDNMGYDYTRPVF